MRVVFIVAIFCICVVVGSQFAKKYKKRANFFKGMVLLTQKLDIGINYSRQRLQSMFKNLDDTLKKDLQNLDTNFLAYLEGENELSATQLFKNVNYLKEQEKEVILMFFKMLGRSDVESQSKEIKNFESRFQEFSSSASLEYKKYGGLSVKMGVIVGLMSAIILW